MIHRMIAVAVIVGTASMAQAMNVSCTDSVNTLGKKNTKSFTVTCPVNCKTGSVWGDGVYTTDSAICVAAVHDGATDTKGGTVKVTLEKGRPAYASSTRNGVTTSQWAAFDKSFKVSK